MEDPSFPTHPPDNSKRMFAGGSSSNGSSFVDADVIEIPPPATWKPKRQKHNLTVHHEVINIDDEDPDIVIIDEKFAPKSKGKKPILNYETKGTSSTDATIVADDFSGINLTDISYDDDCVMLQAHFDNFDVPTGVEAAVPWWPASTGNQSSSSLFNPQLYNPYSKLPTSMVDKTESWSSKAARLKKHLSKSKTPSFGIPTTYDVHASGMMSPLPPWSLLQSSKDKFVKASSFNPFQNGSVANWGFPSLSSVNPVTSHLVNPSTTNPFFAGFGPGYPNNQSIILEDDISAQISPPSTSGQDGDVENSILRRLETFKKFDTLEDHLDHLYNSTKESVKQSKSWSRAIAEEWRMLEKDLPDTIFVRVYEARMDLLRAVIVGADGTPYHDGLFFFDVNFTHAYPKSPPHVKYHAHGLRINPNLYNCGKVCLSLLGTWAGHGEENWRPGKSNMLQVLVSIQGLILNEEPYYNEPGFANSKNSPHGKTASKNYSENTFLLSLKTMLYTMRNPPKKFEDLVYGHFYKRAHDILAACRAYLDGVQVGSFEKGKTPTSKTKRSTCSAMLKSSLPDYIKNLVQAFTKIGVKDCEKYLVSPDNGVNQSGEGSKPTRRKRNRWQVVMN
ncbi:putative ubiquitin-conjugating enzyme E2 26 isoform X2 [Silene latifolia]|uniref:putative ubiquitin-conjugating enzyme E2 26 isoform X2 n=1 Tax=Silene latifolia TaxID=37657 RepID=UPI003D77028C